MAEVVRLVDHVMARNTGRGSRSAGARLPAGWSDVPSTQFVVWSEPEGVVIYEGEKEYAHRRHILTPDEAHELARLLTLAADEAVE